MSRLLILCLLTSLSGCVTSGAVVDLVVPSGIGHTRTTKESGEHLWLADYGSEPQDIGHFPIRLWVRRTGRLELPAGYDGCHYFFTIDPGVPADRPHCTVWFAPSEDRIQIFGPTGDLLAEQRLPAEIPILMWQRWAWLPAAPVLDVLLISILTGAALLYPFQLLHD